MDSTTSRQKLLLEVRPQGGRELVHAYAVPFGSLTMGVVDMCMHAAYAEEGSATR